MRKAKTAAMIFGSVTTCIFGSFFAVYAKAPIVSNADPESSVEVYEVNNEELANSAAFTSIRTTAVTKSSKVTTTTKATNKKAGYSYSAYSTSNKVTYSAPVETTMAVTEAVNVPTDWSTVTTVAYEIVPVVTATQADIQETVPERVVSYDEPVYSEDNSAYTEVVYAEPVVDTPFETPVQEEAPTPVLEEPVQNNAAEAASTNSLPISDSEYIMLCNAVAHEAGSYWIDEYQKAYVVEVIMNRVNSSLYPNSIEGVLTQPYQFSGSSSYVYSGTFTGQVTESVKNAVNLYFNEPSSFAQGYLSFYGDGRNNHFS